MSAPSTGSQFDAERQRHVRAFAERLPIEAERLAWPLERLHRLRDERLRALLWTAKARSPWHATRLAGVDVDAVTGADLAAIPPMTKSDVMEHWDEIVTDRRLTLEMAEAHLERVASDGPAYLLGEYQVVTTGGSSGRRGVFVWDFEGWLGFALSRERPTFWLRGHAGGGRQVRRAFVAAAHATHPTALLPRTFAGSPQLGVGRSFPATLPVSHIVDGLNRFDPTDLFAYPSMMHRLAREMSHGRLSISPWELNCGAEPLLPDARAEIEAAFGRPVMNLYAAAEVGVIARSYPGSIGLHLNEDIAVYEPVDTTTRPVAAGITAAKLLVTNLINHAIPLIRYELADELTVLAEPNPGPWTGRRIADIEGRVEGTFVYDGDVEVHLHLFRSTLGRRRHILEYQVRQTPVGADIAVRTSAPLDTDALSRELAKALAELGVARPEVSVAEVRDIDRTGSTGKLRRFIPLPPQRG
ncbi:MAG: phenylacetate--CoA ligase family protein [Solirubrobacteraceae bacterium]